MAPKSVQRKLTRVRPPCVHTFYELQVGDAIELDELPSVRGWLFTGEATELLPRLREHRFVDINLQNFETVLESVKPHFALHHTLAADPEAGELKPSVKLFRVEGFEPE